MKIPEWLADKHHPRRKDEVTTAPLVERLIEPMARFLRVEAAGGLVLLACTAIALGVANSRWSEGYAAIWQMPIGITTGKLSLSLSLAHWINDGLMTIFFFLAGLEIKREVVFGELRDLRNIALPAAAALGGMLVPAGIYLAMRWNEPGESGWGIPMATDIAFVVGFLALLGRRVPLSLKILLLTLAIVDDIGAILVIAAVYTSDVSLFYLGLAALGFALVYLCNRVGIRLVPTYIILGVAIWLAFLKSGLHPTVAGVLLGFMTPATPWFGERSLQRAADGVANRLRLDREKGDATEHHEDAVSLLRKTAQGTVSPLDRLETALHPWMAFGIMPIFALANAGIRIDISALTDPVALAVAAGLAIGKPLGIAGFSFAAVKIGMARLPTGIGWGALIGAGCLAGVGFTMSLFISGLALTGDLLIAGKLGTMLGSLVSAVAGLGLLLFVLPSPAAQETQLANLSGDSV